MDAFAVSGLQLSLMLSTELYDLFHKLRMEHQESWTRNKELGAKSQILLDSKGIQDPGEDNHIFLWYRVLLFLWLPPFIWGSRIDL